eukprot:scaffold63791_cov41-Attheya_sp.AAC.1
MARLNVHGGKQTKGVDFWETYSPMVTWNSICTFMTLALVNNWHTRQLDFVLAYPQADVECDMYMEISRGFKLPAGKNSKDYALKLRRNLYGSRQASRVWSQYLTKGLIARGEKWNYRSVVGKLNFLEKSTMPDLAYSIHQCSRFSIDPKESHAQAIKQIGRYLMANREKGIILKPNPEMGLEDWVNADFCGAWDRQYAMGDPTTARSRSGYAIRYCGCPITWRSKLQTEVALTTTEAEYVALS